MAKMTLIRERMLSKMGLYKTPRFWSLLVAIWFAIMAAPSHAARDGLFIGAGFSLVDVGVEDFFENSVEFKALQLSAGYKFRWWLGVDARYGLAPTSESVFVAVDPNTNREIGEEVNLDEYISYYYRPELANDIAKIYLLIGQSDITITRESEEGVSVTQSDSGTSYGIGIGLWINRKLDVTFEYIQLLDTPTDSFTSTGFNIEYRF